MDQLIGGLVGAVFGAFATHLLGTLFMRRKERGEIRRRLVGDLASLSYEFLSELQALYAVRLSDPNGEIDHKATENLTNLTRLQGRALQLEVRFWEVYDERQVRAALNKLLNRFEKVHDFYIESPMPPAMAASIAQEWIKHQISETIEFASKAAGIELIDKSRLVFVGFRKVTPEDKRRLSFEDEPPPWRRK